MCTITIKKNWCVYAHINKYNGKRYIGITSQDPQKRWGNNGSHYNGRKQRCFYNAIQKYGWNGFEHKILFRHLTEQEAIEKEKELILKYHTCIYDNPKLGYNMTFGGDGTTGYKHSAETIVKMSEKRKGNGNGFYGKRHSKESKNKMSQHRKNKGVGKSNNFYGCHHSNKTKQLLSELATKRTGELNPNYGNHKLAGENHPLYGKHLSEETKRKISQSRKGHISFSKSVYCHEKDKLYNSIKEAASELNVDASSIGKCCKGKQKSAKGYHFSFVNETNKEEEKC